MKIEDIPKEIRDFIISIGRAQWGETPAHDAAGHANHIADSVRKTAANFDQMEDQPMHGLYIEGTGTIICHTGTSPNSPKSAQALTGLWNWIHDLAFALQRDCTMCDGTGTKDYASLAMEPCDHTVPSDYALTGPLLAFLEGKSQITVDQIIKDLPEASDDRLTRDRLGYYLASWGWSRQKRRGPTPGMTSWVFVRPRENLPA